MSEHTNLLAVLRVIVDRYPGPGVNAVGKDALSAVQTLVDAAEALRASQFHPDFKDRFDDLLAAIAPFREHTDG